MLLTKHLGELLQQLQETELAKRNESADGLIAEIEALGVFLEGMEKTSSAEKTPYEVKLFDGFDGPALIPYSLGPRPDTCKTCGQKLP
ncbi:hypothetical protein [Neorhizobium alkalisoli]|jgi:hypothetical protein|uniref:Uncharacterized protein n=1 Tax=Neorhizobium alkalisoli TaxID=528178 RepID=A0A561QWI1_9HYPH|nr:hypothetical protein [Neorhizobium alkalisoli]TWF54737.1 hypothetical protein FHW37_103607 [Neorhizobium alkalisoli]